MTRNTFSCAKKFVLDYEEVKVDNTEIGSINDDGEGNVQLRLQFWEMRRSERVFLLESSDFRKRFDGYILCYDITKRDTFQFAQKWTQDNISWCNNTNYTPNDTPTASKILILCGTNSDSAEPTENNRGRCIPSEEAKSLAEKYGMDCFVETSSRTGENTDLLFQEIQNIVVQRAAIPHHHEAASAAETKKKTVEYHWGHCRHFILGLVLSILAYCWFLATYSIATILKNLRWKDGEW